MNAFEWREAPSADFAVIGDPVSHSRSPEMHQAAYAAFGMSWRYVALRVPESEVEVAVSHLAQIGYRGLNVTVPNKLVAAQIPGYRDDAIVAQTEAINTMDLLLRRRTNTDAPGMVMVLSSLGILPPAELFVLGAGGTARALVPLLLKLGYRIRVWNRTLARVEAWRDREGWPIQVSCELCVGAAQAVINATSSSLQEEAIAMDWRRNEEGVLAIDLMYAAGGTQFLRYAGNQGVSGLDGRDLLAAQGALSFAWWLKSEPPLAVMRRALALPETPAPHRY